MDFFSIFSNTASANTTMLFSPLRNIMGEIAAFIPYFLAAIIVLIVGMIAIRLVTRWLQSVLQLLKLDKILEKIGLTEELKTLGITLPLSTILVKLTSFVLWLLLLVLVISILHIQQLSDFITRILNYLPNVFVALVILGVGMSLGKFLQRIIEQGSEGLALSPSQAKILGKIAHIAVVAFSAMAALVQLGIAESLIQIFFTGIMAMIAIAGGIAFGLGGKDKAKEWIDKL